VEAVAAAVPVVAGSFSPFEASLEIKDMKRQSFLVSLVGTVLVGLGLSAVPASAQKPQVTKAAPAMERLESHGLNAGEMAKAKLAVERPGSNKSFAVVEEFTGSFNDVDAHLASFNKEFNGQGLNKGLKGNPTSILVIYEDPTGKSSFRMAIGLEVPSRMAVKAPLKAEAFNEPKAARFTHVGGYERLKNVHEGIDEHAKARKVATHWPVILRLLSDPKKTPAGQLKTEMIVPL
jgi:hypothetical protein